MNYMFKTRIKLGDIDGLERELRHFLDRGHIRKIAESFHEKYGGLESMDPRWVEYRESLYSTKK